MPVPTVATNSGDDAPSVVFATVVEDQPSFRDRALNLAISIREFGGNLAGSSIVVCAVDSLDDRTRGALADLGVRVEIVSVFDERNRRSNKLRVLEALATEDHDHVVSLDSDIIVCGDVADHLPRSAIGLTPASREALPEEEWQRLFAAVDLAPPRRSLVAPLSGELIYPYFNSGVVVVPGPLVARLHRAWAEAEREMLALAEDQPQLLHRWAHLNQFGLMIALARTGLAVDVLPYEMNLHTSATADPGSPADARFTPLLLHYHNKLDPRGFVRRTRTPGTASPIERFNAARARHTGQSPPPTRWDRARASVLAVAPDRLLAEARRR